MYNDHKQSGHLSTNLQAKKYIYPVFDLSHSTIYKSTPDFKYVQWSYIVRTLINISTGEKISIPKFFYLSHSNIYKSTPNFKHVHWSYTVRTPINKSTSQKIYIPPFWLESQYYLQINTWFQICTMIIYSQDTYQQIYKQKKIYTPFFTWVTVLSTNQHLISNMYNDHMQSGHLSTNLQAK